MGALPSRGLELNVTAGASSRSGPYARAEVGWRPAPPITVYGFGEWTPRERQAGIGAKLRF